MGYIQLAQDEGPKVGCCVPGNELSGSIKQEFHDLSNCTPLASSR